MGIGSLTSEHLFRWHEINEKQKEALRDAVSQYRTSPIGGIARSPSVNPGFKAPNKRHPSAPHPR